MTTLTAHRYCPHTYNAPSPPHALVKAMLAELDGQLRAAGMRPRSLGCGSWHVANEREYVAMLAITVEPGENAGTLTSWYQWQHPIWRWIEPPVPLDLTRAETLLG